MISRGFNSRLSNILMTLVFFLLLTTTIWGQENLETIFTNFKTAAKASCGQREEAIRLGKLIIEKFGNDELNKEVIDFVKKKTNIIEQEEPRCKSIPNNGTKNWKEFFATSKEIIAAEGDSPLVLDVMLTAASVGFDRAVIDKDDSFNADTIYYAKSAIQKIEAGQTSKTGKWGVFVPFNSKENALGWMNYIVGWLSYNKFNQKREALGYFYKAIQSKSDGQNKVTVYRMLGDSYLDESKTLETKFQQNRKNFSDDETKARANLINGYIDRAIDAYGRAFKLSVENKEKKALINNFYKIITNLYRSRFKFGPKDKVEGLDEYIEKLVSRPMPDLTTPIKPILEDPVEVRIKRNKLQ